VEAIVDQLGGREVVDLVRLQPKTIARVVACLWDPDGCVRMRAADAAEKVFREQAVLLQPYKKAVLGLLAEIFRRYLEDRSSIVRTFAMQGLSDLTGQHPSMLTTVLDLLRTLTRSGTPAIRARGRILLRQLESRNP